MTRARWAAVCGRSAKPAANPLRVVAGLAGISAGHLSRIENGLRALDSRALTVALANALQISPSELMKFLTPAPADGDADAAVEDVRLALLAVNHNQPCGQIVAVETLRAR